MKKITVKNLVEFRKKTDRGKRSFVERIKSNKAETSKEGGGDYWVSSLSAVCRAFKNDDPNVIDDKIIELQQKIADTVVTITKNMYQRNIAVLQSCKNIDFRKIRPSGRLLFLSRAGSNPILVIKGVQVEARPNLIYLFGKKGEESIASIWFVAKKDGYSIEEIGMFSEMTYRFLKHNYMKKYQLAPKYCVAIDILKNQIVNYSDIENGTISPILNQTLDQIVKLI